MLINNTPFDKEKIGKRLELFSGEHKVYLYGKNKVIKFPSGPIHFFNKKEALNKIENDFHFSRKYFRDFLIPAKLYFYKENDKEKYCVIQDYVAGQPLKLEKMCDPKITKQFEKIYKLNERLKKETLFSIEFFGIYSLIFHLALKRMDNIILCSDKKLKIMDYGLISKQKKITSSIILDLIVKWASYRQDNLIKKYLTYCSNS